MRVSPSRRCRQPLASLEAADATIVFGSGWPAAPLNPLGVVLAAIEGPPGSTAGSPGRGDRRADAARIRDHGLHGAGAYASFDEQRKGTISPGMLADLVVLTEDIFGAPASRLAADRSGRHDFRRQGRLSAKHDFHAITLTVRPQQRKSRRLADGDRPLRRPAPIRQIDEGSLLVSGIGHGEHPGRVDRPQEARVRAEVAHVVDAGRELKLAPAIHDAHAPRRRDADVGGVGPTPDPLMTEAFRTST
jgi:hypothetical protein